MNNLGKLGVQLREIWKQLGASQRVSVIVATVGLLAGLGAISWWSARGDYALLYGKLSDTESAKVIQALDDAKIPYRISNGGSAISVPADKVHLTRMQLAGKGIPRNGDGVGFEIFDKPNFGISDFVQRANYIRAVQGELARTIGQIDEVESARVMIVLPENRLLLDKDKHPTASVFLRMKGNSQLQAASVNSIRFLVANSVEGLKPNYVSIVDNMGNALSENPDNDSTTGLTSAQLSARRTLEQYLGRKAQDMLEKVVGPGQAIVRVSAEINFDTMTRTEERYDPDGQVIRTETKNEENNDSVTATVSAPAGLTANTIADTNATAAAPPVTNTKNHKNTSTIEYEVGRTTSSMSQAAGGIKRLSAAVSIAARYEGTGADRKLITRTPEELEKLRRIVIGAVGIQQAPESTRGDTLTVEELPFNDQFAAELTSEQQQQEKRQYWWELARNLALPAAGLVAFLVLIRLFKRTPVQEIPLGVPVGRLNGRNGHGQTNGNGHWQNEPAPGVVNVEVLNRLLKENPTNLTQAIREWMNKGTPSEN